MNWFLTKLFGRQAKHQSSRRRPRTCLPGVAALDDKQLLTIGLPGGILGVVGTNLDDRITIDHQTDAYHTDTSLAIVHVTDPTTGVPREQAGFRLVDVQSIQVQALDGNDVVRNDLQTALPDT